MDEFKLSWSAYNSIIEEYEDHMDCTWIFDRFKKDNESLRSFLRENEEKVVIPKYIINDIDIASYLNDNYYKANVIDAPEGSEINAIYTEVV